MDPVGFSGVGLPQDGDGLGTPPEGRVFLVQALAVNLDSFCKASWRHLGMFPSEQQPSLLASKTFQRSEFGLGMGLGFVCEFNKLPCV